MTFIPPRFEHDDRIILARTPDDFSLIGTFGICGAILPNPNTVTPHTQKDVLKALTRTRRGGSQVSFERDEFADKPLYVRETCRLIFKSMDAAHRRYCMDTVFVRTNSSVPVKPHRHAFGVIADVFGSTTVGYTNDDESRPYDFPANSIIGIENILHRAGDVKNPAATKPVPEVKMGLFGPRIKIDRLIMLMG